MWFQGLNRHTPHLMCTLGGGGGVCTQCACVVAPPPFDPFKPLEWAHACASAHTPPFSFPVGGQAAAPPPEGAPGICESTPITSPQLEAMNQLVTLLFYPGRITLTTSLRKFRGVCPLRWTEGHTHAAINDGEESFLEGRWWRRRPRRSAASPEAPAYSVALYFWIEIMGDVHILHAEQLSGGSCLNKLQHARTLYKTY